MKLTPTPEQGEDIQRILAEPTKAALIASEPGAGKTNVGCELIVRTWSDTVLVVGVKATFNQWHERLLEQSDGFAVLRHIDASKSGHAAMNDYLAGKKGFYFVGIQYLSAKDHRLESHNPPKFKNGKEVKKRIRLKTWEKVTPDMIIYDESHMAARRFSNGSNTLLGLKATWKIAMSGTFYGERFENAYTPARWLWPERSAPGDIADSSFARWKMRFCETRDQYIPGGKKNPGEFVTLLPCYVRREVLAPIPDPIDVQVDITPEQRRVYLDLENQLLSWIKDHPLTVEWPITLQAFLRLVCLAEPDVNPDTRMIQFRSDAGSSKVDEAITLLSGRWSGENVFHLTHSKRYAYYLADKLNAAGFKSEVYSGDTSAVERERIKSEFAAGRLQNLVAVTKAAKLGLDALQLNCCKVLEHSTQVGEPGSIQQAIRRIWRQGNPRLGEFEWVRLHARDTIETGTYQSIDLQAAEQLRTMRGAK